MQLSEIRTRVRALAGIRSSALLTDAEIDEYVSEFNQDLSERYNWPQRAATQTVTIVQSHIISFPTDARSITAIVVVNGGNRFPVVASSEIEFDGLDATAVGRPTRYLANPLTRQITLWPKPPAGMVLEIDVKKGPARLSLPTDSPDFEAEYHVAWALAGAISALQERGGNDAKVRALSERLISIVSRMRKRYLFSQDREPLSLPTRW